MADDKKVFPIFNMDKQTTRVQRNSSGAIIAGTLDSQAQIQQVKKGIFKPGVGQSQRSSQEVGETDRRGAGPVLVHGRGFNKKASIIGGEGGFGGGNGGRTDRMGPEIYSPLFQIANLNLPRDRITMNAWNRVFYDTNPVVRNAINLHATYPISKINIKCKNKRVEQYFNDMAEKINLADAIAGIALEYWKLGEAFPYAELDANNSTWSDIIIQNPDFIEVSKSMMSNTPSISLRPDAELNRIINGTTSADMKLRQQIPEDIIHYVKKKQNIPLNNFNISHLKMLSSNYDLRGTSLIVSCYKVLMQWDKIFEAKLAQADDMINPITLIKVGGGAEGDMFHPNADQLQAWRETFEASQNDKDFKIITHAGVSVERIGANSGIIDTSNDFNFILDMLYAGLMVPKSVMTQDGAAFASASVGLEVLKSRYITFRHMVERWLETKIFAPIAEMNEFYDYKDKEKILTIPQIDWNKINLYDVNDYITALSGHVGDKVVSVHTLYHSLGLNYEEEQRQLREEAIRAAILLKEEAELKNKTLSELRAIGSDDIIIESQKTPEAPVAGEDVPPEGGDELNMPPGDAAPAMPGPDLGAPPSAAPETPPLEPPAGAPEK